MNEGSIRGVRKRLGLTQEQLADLVDASRPSVHRWEEAGCARPPLVLAAVVEAAGEDCLPECPVPASGPRWGWYAELFDRLHALRAGAAPLAERLAAAEQDRDGWRTRAEEAERRTAGRAVRRTWHHLPGECVPCPWCKARHGVSVESTHPTGAEWRARCPVCCATAPPAESAHEALMSWNKAGGR